MDVALRQLLQSVQKCAEETQALAALDVNTATYRGQCRDATPEDLELLIGPRKHVKPIEVPVDTNAVLQEVQDTGDMSVLFHAIAELCRQGGFEMSPPVKAMQESYEAQQMHLAALQASVSEAASSQRATSRKGGDFGIYRLEEDIKGQVADLEQRCREAEAMIARLDQEKHRGPSSPEGLARDQIEDLSQRLRDMGAGDVLAEDTYQLWEQRRKLQEACRAELKSDVAALVENDTTIKQLRAGTAQRLATAQATQQLADSNNNAAALCMQAMWEAVGQAANRPSPDPMAQVLLLLAQNECAVSQLESELGGVDVVGVLARLRDWGLVESLSLPAATRPGDRLVRLL